MYYDDPNDRADVAAEEMTDAVDTALLKNDWDQVFHIRARAAGGDSFVFEVYVSDEHMESEPTYESYEGLTFDDAWRVVGNLEALFSGPLVIADVARAIGHQR